MRITIRGLEQLKAAARELRATPEAMDRAAYRTINAVVAKVMTRARRDIGAEINLPQSYIADQMSATKAGPGKLYATVRTRVRPIRMARFDARQLTVAAKRAKGDARRGIPAGRKQAGVSVKINRHGGRTSRKAGFLIPLRAGKESGGNGMGLFVRVGPGEKDIKHKTGPSPDQLFRRWRGEKRPDIQRMLIEAYVSQLRFEIRGKRK